MDKKEIAEIYAATLTQRLQEKSKLEPRVAINLSGTEYFLEFTNRAIREIHKAVKLNLLATNLTPGIITDPEVVNALLTFGLAKYHPDITSEKVDEIFTLRHFPYVSGRIYEALDTFYPDMSDVLDSVRDNVQDPPRGQGTTG